MGKTGFDLKNSKQNYFLSISLFLALKKSMNTFPNVAGFKNVKKLF